MSGVSIPIEAKMDSSQVDRALAELTQEINKLGSSVATANKVKFNPIDKATLADMQRVKEQFDSLTKISSDFKKRLKDTGQSGSDFFGIDWSKVYVDANVRSRQMRKAFEYVTAGTGAHFQDIPRPAAPAPAPSPGSGGGSSNTPPAPPPPPPAPPSPGSTWRSAGRSVVGSGLNALGPAGSVANGALDAGLSGGAMAGLAGLAGGLLALGVGKLISSAKAKVGAAEQENVGYDTLKRQLGDVGVGFDVLKESLRAASDGLNLTYQEGQRLGAEFVKLSGMSAENYRTLASEVKIGGGFGRSFGMDPSQSNAFFAQMRQFQVTTNDQGSRQLALMISEGIAKSGAFAKADEMLGAISSYTSQQTRLGLATANVGDYAGLLSGLVGSRTPGLDPSGAAGLLARVNSSIQNGGNAGGAGQNFMYMAIGKPLGLDPIQTKLLLQQGAFGTGAGLFGSGSLVGNWMDQNGAPVSARARNSQTTNLELVMSAIRRQYNGNPEMRELALNAGGNLLGINESAMAALMSISPNNLHGLTGRLQRNGIDLSKLDPTNVSRMAQIEADASLNDDQKNEAIKKAAPQSQEATLGSEIRDTKTAISNKLQALADKAVPLLNDIRSGILYMAGGKDGVGPMAIARAVIDAQHKENRAGINSTQDALVKEQQDAEGKYVARRTELGRKLNGSNVSAADRQKYLAELDALEKSKDDPKKRMTQIEAERKRQLEAEDAQYKSSLADLKASQSVSTDSGASPVAAQSAAGGTSPGAGGTTGGDKAAFMAKYRALAEQAGKEMGVSPNLILSQIALETGWGKKEVPGSNNPFNIKAGRGWLGGTVSAVDNATGTTDPYRAYGSRSEAFADYVSMMKRRYPGALNAGSDAAKFTAGLVKGHYAESSTYATDLQRIASGMGTPMPDEAKAVDARARQEDARRQWFAFEHNITLRYPNGQQAAPTAQLTKEVKARVPS